MGTSSPETHVFLSRKSWDFPVEIFPLNPLISWQRQEEEDAAKSAGPSGAKALTDQAPWQDQDPGQLAAKFLAGMIPGTISLNNSPFLMVNQL